MADSTALRTVLALVVLVLAGCSSSSDDQSVVTIRQTTETMISSDVAEVAGLGDLLPLCPEVNAASVGTSFDCTATTEDQRVLSLTATIDELGHVRLATTNIITGPALPSFERAAVAALNEKPGIRLADDAIDCGELTVVFGQDKVMVCTLFEPATDKIFDVTINITDIEARLFTLVVADTPRA